MRTVVGMYGRSGVSEAETGPGPMASAAITSTEGHDKATRVAAAAAATRMPPPGDTGPLLKWDAG